MRRIGRLVDDLLDLTRLEAHQFRLVREEVGLEALLEQAATAFREKARVNDVQFDALTTGAPTVLSDGDRVLQVVTNLLDNAFRWTPRDGTVTLSYSAANGNAAIHVSDTGPGIPQERPGGGVPPVLQPPRRGRHRARPLDRPRAGARAGRAADGGERGRPRHDLHAVPADRCRGR